ncbi:MULTISPECIES: LON peptidase substrate-binding domain-containing protein [Bradyrhizobium]|jgi:ATP-dependent Lon protease|uniref:LON peptidase substrate-binding domain-containing protein n=1 Tax=Bradyrhizobium TaxID=374 RepID=UPI0003A5068D|nr:LON peptidase substrate-binding domain-containing protein [Bradyrhizobium denitrificans]MCL8484767.1 LON peptidase substrate-binding domain-containing protein [Bradyrhizobium denitrificans]
MRDFRDAKLMAQTLRDSLTTKSITISHSQSLELVSRMFGVADWNTLSALIKSGDGTKPQRAPVIQTTTVRRPAIPLRDLVPFPGATYPLFVGRAKTINALNDAFARQTDLVIALQKQRAVDQPGFADLHEIGLRADLMELSPLPDGTLKVQVRIGRRVLIRAFSNDGSAYEAEVSDIAEDGAADAPDLILRAVTRFERYAAIRNSRMPESWPPFGQGRQPGTVADTIAAQVLLPLAHKYELLAVLDQIKRLELVEALLDVTARPLSSALQATRQRAIASARDRRHRHATLEHLLLALVDDDSAAAVMKSCRASLKQLRTKTLAYVDTDLAHLAAEDGEIAQPSPAFLRVSDRAALAAQEVGYPMITGANTLLALFPETRSPAARLLAEHGVTLVRAAKAVADGVGKEEA